MHITFCLLISLLIDIHIFNFFFYRSYLALDNVLSALG